MNPADPGRVHLAREDFELTGTPMEIGIRLSSQLLVPALMQTMQHIKACRRAQTPGAEGREKAALDIADLLTGVLISHNALAIAEAGPEAAALLLQRLLLHTQQHGARHLAEAEAEAATTCHPPTSGMH